jgi:hypothetical protein
MTLIVARSENDKVFITSDTLLSKINGERLPYEQCVINTQRDQVLHRAYWLLIPN